MEKYIKFTTSWFLILLVLGWVFYWFEWRPTKIKKDCFNSSIEFNTKVRVDLFGDNLKNQEDQDYKTCLMEKGLKG